MCLINTGNYFKDNEMAFAGKYVLMDSMVVGFRILTNSLHIHTTYDMYSTDTTCTILLIS